MEAFQSLVDAKVLELVEQINDDSQVATGDRPPIHKLVNALRRAADFIGRRLFPNPQIFQRTVNGMVLELVEDITGAAGDIPLVDVLGDALCRTAQIIEENEELRSFMKASKLVSEQLSTILAEEEKDVKNRLLAESSMLPSRKFTIFPQLPIEIRYLVWDRACDLVNPRIVEIVRRRRQKHGDDYPYTPDPNPEHPFISPTPCHPLLHACRESRKIMLQKWPLSFGDASHKPRIPFNFAIDTLYVPPEIVNERSFGQRVSLEERNMLTRVIIQLGRYKRVPVPLNVRNDLFTLHLVQMLNEDFPNLATLDWITVGPRGSFEVVQEEVCTEDDFWEMYKYSSYEPGDTLLVNYEKYFHVDLDINYDNVLPYFLGFAGANYKNYVLAEFDVEGGFIGPEFKNCEGNFPLTTLRRIKMEIIGVNLDSWGNRLDAGMKEPNMRGKVRRLHISKFGNGERDDDENEDEDEDEESIFEGED